MYMYILTGGGSRCSVLEKKVKELELSRAKLHQENSQLSENLQLVQDQLLSYQERKEIKENELNELREQLNVMSSTSDHKTLIGQLQQEILALKVHDYY